MSQNANALIRDALSVMAGAAPSLKPGATVLMRRRTDWSPVASTVDLILGMPLPSDEELQRIVDALARKMTEAPRLGLAVAALGDVHEAIAHAAPAPADQLDLSCESCTGTGGERAPCKPCGGRGVGSAFGSAS